MKCGKTYSRMMRRSVRGTLSRFLAILCIVALGTGFLCGLLSTEPDMKTGADKYYDEQNAMDFLIQGTLGLTQADVEALEKEPYIEQAAGKYSQDMLMRGDTIIVVADPRRMISNLTDIFLQDNGGMA